MAEAEELVKELKLGSESWWRTGQTSGDIRNELASKGDKAVGPLAEVLKDKGQPSVAREGAAQVFESMMRKGTAEKISQKHREVMVDAVVAGLNDANFAVYSTCAWTLTGLAEHGLIGSLNPEFKEKAVKGLASIVFKEDLGVLAVEGLNKIDYSDISGGTRKQAIDALNRFIDRRAGKDDHFWADRASDVIKKIEKSARLDVSAKPAKEMLEKSIKGVEEKKKVKRF